MAVEEDFLVRINYQLEGVERSISTSRRALFTLNAIRLSIRDIQQVISGPTLQNVLWTAIQLTRTLTQARRLTKALAAEQVGLGAASLLGVGGGAAGGIAAGRALAAGQTTLFPPAVAGAGFLGGFGAVVIPIVGAASVAIALRLYEEQQKRNFREHEERNRAAAKAQGLEP